MKSITLNCTDVSSADINCEYVSSTYISFEKLGIIISLIFSIFGLISNSICVYIFYLSKNMEAKFLQMLKYFTLNSLFANLNDSAFIVLLLVFNKTVFILNGENQEGEK